MTVPEAPAVPPYTVEERNGRWVRVYTSDQGVIVRCGDCKGAWRSRYDVRTEQYAGDRGRQMTDVLVRPEGSLGWVLMSKHMLLDRVLLAGRTCPNGDGGPLRVVKVKGTLNTERTCDPRCTNAVGPTCSCQCAGANHGAGLAPLPATV